MITTMTDLTACEQRIVQLREQADRARRRANHTGDWEGYYNVTLPALRAAEFERSYLFDLARSQGLL